MRRPRARRLLLATVVALSATVPAGCGRVADVAGDRSIAVGLSEYRITPQHLRLSAGLLTIAVHNYGKLTHNLAVSLDGQAQASTSPLQPGQSADLGLQLAPGTYSMASTLLSDQALGQYGTLTVTR